MVRRLRRLRRLLLLAALIGALGALLQRRAATARTVAPAAPPRWPPIEFEPIASTPTQAQAPTPTPTPTAAWALPVDGECPSGFPIKAIDRSRIYHVPGGRFYERTIPERCYANQEDALADGYRAAKA